MELHDHPDLHHKRKNVGGYFLECFMICLAFTMRFLAETLSEHVGDQSNEKEFSAMSGRCRKDSTPTFVMENGAFCQIPIMAKKTAKRTQLANNFIHCKSKNGGYNSKSNQAAQIASEIKTISKSE